MSKTYFSLSREDSLMIKGLAILLMIFHHVFGLYSLDQELPVIVEFRESHTFIVYIAQLGKVCVNLFLIVTAYGMVDKYLTDPLVKTGCIFKRDWVSFLNFYKRYFFAVVFIIGLLLCGLISVKSASGSRLQDIFYMLSLWDTTVWNPDWWYTGIFAFAVLVFSPLMVVIRDMFQGLPCFWNHICSMLVSFLVWEIFFLLYHGIPGIYTGGIDAMKYMIYFIVFFQGFVIFRGQNARNLFFRERLVSFLILVILGSFCLAFHFDNWGRSAGLFYMSMICVPFFLFLARRFPVRKLFCILGTYSIYMWLMHRFIFDGCLTDWLYRLNPVLIFSIVAVSSFLIAWVMAKIYGLCQSNHEKV